MIAGAGNVLRAEALFRAGVHPSTPAAALDRDGFHRVWVALVDLMVQSVEDGRIISAPLPAAARATVDEAEGRMVYKQARCRACATPVETGEVAGRALYACPRCQPH